ncbi:hypothetical protein [Haliea sp. E17]|uniref:hypothetical protein n=1 Tax=Haliea sp. E17 TaxID=3401576 RepID=UPI003AAFE0F8
MKRKDDGKTSLVEFLSSIRFSRKSSRTDEGAGLGQFAAFDQQVCPARLRNHEDQFLVRSAN